MDHSVPLLPLEATTNNIIRTTTTITTLSSMSIPRALQSSINNNEMIETIPIGEKFQVSLGCDEFLCIVDDAFEALVDHLTLQVLAAIKGNRFCIFSPSHKRESEVCLFGKLIVVDTDQIFS